ncbi:MAG TPA: glycosyltransferase [Gemmatimonadaceae bacterium]
MRACVLMPALDAERYLADAIASVLRQSATELELIVVDDGSTDRTLDIARAVRDERVRVLTGPNRGRAHARNVGFAAAAASPYVALLDADDLWDADKLAVQLEFLDRRPDVQAVGCFMRYIASNGRVLGRTGQTIDAADLHRIARGELAPFPISSCLVVRREAFTAVGGFDPSLREAEDLDFLARIARRGAIACVPEVLGSYRIHPESAMARHRVRVNTYARFVRQRLAAGDAGRMLTWDQFSAAYRPTWRERSRDRTECWYRSAALWYGEGRRIRAMGYAALAALAAPSYTLRRLYRQRFAGAGAGTEHRH